MVYSFEDVQATIAGPGGTFSLGAGSANAKEGISIEYVQDKNKMTIGADGSPMHSLIACNAAKIMVRLLKTSPVNQRLTELYNFQTRSSQFHGQNVIRVSNPVIGDDYTFTQAAFSKFPRNDYPEEAGMLDWNFDGGVADVILGSGILVLS